MKLYYAPASTYSQRVSIALYEKNASFTPIVVDLEDSSVRDRYLQINPFGKIPALETSDGQILFEACIIIEYLDLSYQKAPHLLSQNPKQALEIRMLERIVDVYINNARQMLFRDSQLPIKVRGSKEIVKAQWLLEKACTFLDERLQDRTWLAGEEFSLADCAAAPTLAYLRMVYDYQHLPRLTDYVRRLESRPSVMLVQNQGRDQMNQMLATLAYPLKLVPL